MRSEWLARVLLHVVREAREFESFAGVPNAPALAAEVSRLRPHVVVATPASFGNEPAARIAELKSASRGSRVLLIVSADEACMAPLALGADAYVCEDVIVSALVPEIRRLTATIAPGRPARPRAQ